MLSVNDGRSRQRSRSQGRRERSTSRDVRAPSPARRAAPPSDDEAPKRSSRKSVRYYEEDPSSDETRKKSSRKSKKAYDEDSGSDKAPPRQRRDDRGYEVAEPRRKHHDDDDDVDTEYDSRRRKEERAYDDGRTKSRRDDSPKRVTYVEPSERKREKEYRDPRHDSEYRDGRHPSYGEAPSYQYAQPAEVTRHMSFSRPGEERDREYAPPGAFVDEPGRHPEQTRHMSIQTQGGHYQDPTHMRSPTDGYTAPYKPAAPAPQSHYQVPQKYQYAQPSHDIKYLSKSNAPQYTATPEAQIEVERKRHNRDDPRDQGRGYERERERDRDYGRGHGRTEIHGHHGDQRYVEIHPGGGGAMQAPRSPGLQPQSLDLGLKRLSVHAGGSGLAAPSMHSPLAGGLPPGSPLLEAYQGTYQSISPMPSPMALPSAMDDGLSDIEPLEPEYGSDDSQHRRPLAHSTSKKKKGVVIYDPEADALAIAAELKHAKPEAGPLVKILPRLTDDHVLALRAEYKKHFKVGGKGINVAKHIKMKVGGNLGKVAYATALGRWESEAHWANFWYQSGSSRRELLIESLMGRTNIEIRNIKAAFSDKRYGDSLERCMQTELKKDKFRHAVLLALEEKRMEETERISRSRVAGDVSDLYKALVAKEGGETAMIEIIVVRSDAHLREVLHEFEAKYKRNFAREMIQKSRNLVVRLLPPCFPFPFHPTSPDSRLGRDPRAHSQRRPQPARARRAAPAPGARRDVQGPRRAAGLAPGALPLGAAAPGARAGRVPRALQGAARARPRRRHQGRLWRVLRRAV